MENIKNSFDEIIDVLELYDYDDESEENIIVKVTNILNHEEGLQLLDTFVDYLF